eukprot:GHVP01039202.1.p1 GENE.GHVP01039202.1~~GHVP01039202.1.p1  ORF type:complete len:109 (+),score=21.19 GHVP01039202.1:35-361(+)
MVKTKPTKSKKLAAVFDKVDKIKIHKDSKNDIDSLFSGVKPKSRLTLQPKKVKKSKSSKKFSAHGSAPEVFAPRQNTEEGYKIYTEEELGLGKGGGTEDCPFDCNCCF